MIHSHPLHTKVCDATSSNESIEYQNLLLVCEDLIQGLQWCIVKKVFIDSLNRHCILGLGGKSESPERLVVPVDASRDKTSFTFFQEILHKSSSIAPNVTVALIDDSGRISYIRLSDSICAEPYNRDPAFQKMPNSKPTEEAEQV